MIDQRERRIVGLGPGPYALDERPFSWPTAGFDRHEWLYVFRQAGKPRPTRAEWIALADEMLARWSAFRAALESDQAKEAA